MSGSPPLSTVALVGVTEEKRDSRKGRGKRTIWGNGGMACLGSQENKLKEKVGPRIDPEHAGGRPRVSDPQARRTGPLVPGDVPGELWE